MKIVIAPDSFKESLSAKQVAHSIAKGIEKVIPKAEIVQIPVSDGGEGLLDALIEPLVGKITSVKVKDPLYRDIHAAFGILEDKHTGIIEMATASGLELLTESEKNPLITSTFGTGQLIKEALDRGCSKIIIGLGGSATNDGGIGMIKALGGKFLNIDGEEIGDGGGALDKLYSIDLSNFDQRIGECEIIAACDVSNPLTGIKGASLVYGAQKGGNPKQLEQLDRNLLHYASIIRSSIGIDIDTPAGAGAAGGLGGTLLGFFNAKLISGIDLIIESLELERHVKDADLVITGEGKIDSQTLHGKTVLGVAAIAKKYNVPVIAIAGKVGDGIDEIYDLGVTSIYSIIDQPMKLEEAMEQADNLIRSCIENIMRMVKYNL